MANISLEERQAMIQELDAVMGLEDDPDIPDDAITAREYADAKGLTYDTAKHHLTRACELGKLKRDRAYRETAAGAKSRQWVYWIA
jgi:hypothetical protein